jgi:hypothetical protein
MNVVSWGKGGKGRYDICIWHRRGGGSLNCNIERPIPGSSPCVRRPRVLQWDSDTTSYRPVQHEAVLQWIFAVCDPRGVSAAWLFRHAPRGDWGRRRKTFLEPELQLWWRDGRVLPNLIGCTDASLAVQRADCICWNLERYELKGAYTSRCSEGCGF